MTMNALQGLFNSLGVQAQQGRQRQESNAQQTLEMLKQGFVQRPQAPPTKMGALVNTFGGGPAPVQGSDFVAGPNHPGEIARAEQESLKRFRRQQLGLERARMEQDAGFRRRELKMQEAANRREEEMHAFSKEKVQQDLRKGEKLIEELNAKMARDAEAWTESKITTELNRLIQVHQLDLQTQKVVFDQAANRFWYEIKDGPTGETHLIEVDRTGGRAPRVVDLTQKKTAAQARRDSMLMSFKMLMEVMRSSEGKLDDLPNIRDLINDSAQTLQGAIMEVQSEAIHAMKGETEAEVLANLPEGATLEAQALERWDANTLRLQQRINAMMQIARGAAADTVLHPTAPPPGVVSPDDPDVQADPAPGLDLPVEPSATSPPQGFRTFPHRTGKTRVERAPMFPGLEETNRRRAFQNFKERVGLLEKE